jgi:hypothetical protein
VVRTQQFWARTKGTGTDPAWLRPGGVPTGIRADRPPLDRYSEQIGAPRAIRSLSLERIRNRGCTMPWDGEVRRFASRGGQRGGGVAASGVPEDPLGETGIIRRLDLRAHLRGPIGWPPQLEIL